MGKGGGCGPKANKVTLKEGFARENLLKSKKKKKIQDVEKFTRKTQANCYRNTVDAFRTAVRAQ